MKFILTSVRLCFCLWLASILAMAQGTCVLTSDPTTKTIKLTGNCGAIAGVTAQPGYTVDNNDPAQPTPPATPAEPPKLEDMSAVPPIVTYENGELTIVARNSTLSDILEAVRNKTGTEFEIPEGASEERVVSKIGPAPARDVLASLLNGSHFNYVMLGTEADPNAFAQLVMTPKPATGTTPTAANNAAPAHATPPVQSLVLTPNAAAATASAESGSAPQPAQSPILPPKVAAAINQSTEDGSAPQTGARALLPQLIPRTLPAWELQQAQQQAQQQPPEQQESTDASAAKETGTPDPAGAAQAASGNGASVPEPATTSDAQQPSSSNPPEAQTPMQVLEGLYGVRRAMIEQQRKPPAPGQQQ